MIVFEFVRHLFYYFGVAMMDEFLYQAVRESAGQPDLVPKLLVHVPRSFDFEMLVAKFHGIVQVNHGEYLS